MSEWKSKREVKQRYDSTAHIYDRRYSEEQTAKIEAALEHVNLQKRGLVLDAGCGTGLLFNHFANKAESLVGLDISRKMLLQAKNRERHLSDAHLIWGEADNMPLKEDAFDYVFAITLIQNTPSPIETLNEIKRVAKRDAVMVITGLKKKFTLKDFETLLHDAGLSVIALQSENLNCHVAVCKLY
jgi:ubiquinone/menaquinone biosynthesis C-methylase UbiE